MTLTELGQKVPEVMFYAFIKLPEGKMSTRKGNVVFMDDLLEEAKAHAAAVVRELRGDLSDDEIDTISEAVGVSAVRFNIVKVSPDKGFTFRWEDALSLKERVLSVVMYSHTRACSIARKVGRDSIPASLGEVVPAMHELLRSMASYPDKLHTAVSKTNSHLRTVYARTCDSVHNSFC